ncbi:MAG: ribosome maturation factor RimP [Gammaproteobacteria bacterium]
MIEPLVQTMGYELVLLEFSPHKGSAMVRLFIDAPGGVTLGDCEKVSREVEGVLDVEDPIPQNYRLEVSSPGLDRPLVKPAHFERFAGSVAKLQLVAPKAGRRKFQGVLKGLKDGRVVLETADAGVVELGLDEIERARLVPDYETELSGS